MFHQSEAGWSLYHGCTEVWLGQTVALLEFISSCVVWFSGLHMPSCMRDVWCVMVVVCFSEKCMRRLFGTCHVDMSNYFSVWVMYGVLSWWRCVSVRSKELLSCPDQADIMWEPSVMAHLTDEDGE
jgi:hypothetical protein